jgi:hypothetical protein
VPGKPGTCTEHGRMEVLSRQLLMDCNAACAMADTRANGSSGSALPLTRPARAAGRSQRAAIIDPEDTAGVGGAAWCGRDEWVFNVYGGLQTLC